MSLTGLCQVCETAEGRFTCDRCGQFVCGEHFDTTRATCVECVRRGGGDPDVLG